MKELIEKYDNIINRINKEIEEDPEFSEEFESEIMIYSRFIEDLKKYEKKLYQLPNNPGQIFSIPNEPNYPPLRERLICSIIPVMKGFNDDKIAKYSIELADEIIKQLNQE